MYDRHNSHEEVVVDWLSLLEGKCFDEEWFQCIFELMLDIALPLTLSTHYLVPKLDFHIIFRDSKHQNRFFHCALRPRNDFFLLYGLSTL